jgi:frataxin-like iron-binding protein CyaY
MIDWTPVNSTSVARVGHDAAANQLHIQFIGGGQYIFHDVPRSHFDDLLAAPSVGKHFQQQIKGKFAHTRVGADTKKAEASE